LLKGERRKMKNKFIVFLVLALLSTSAFLSVRPVFAADVTLPFQDGFETGDFSKWNGGSGGSVTSGGAQHGTYKAVFSSSYRQAWFTSTPQDHCFMRAYIWLDTVNTGWETSLFGLYISGTYMAEAKIINVAGTLKWELRYYNNGISNTAVSEQQKPVLHKWYCVEVEGKSHTTTNAESRMYVDGNELTDVTHTGLNNNYQMTCGYLWISGTGTIWYDDVVIATSYIGPETYTLSASVSPVGSGAVSKNPDQATYNWGTNVELTAHANLGWTFGSWSGGASGTSNPVTVTITDDTAVTATFTQCEYSIGVTVLPSSAAGTVTPDLPGPYHYGDVVTLSESPSLGYAFSGWSGDGVDGAGNTRVVTVTGNMAVTANFAQAGAPPPAVGGEWVPINKLQLSAPLIILASLMTALTVPFVYVRRKRLQD
jgi:hypothetical protein